MSGSLATRNKPIISYCRARDEVPLPMAPLCRPLLKHLLARAVAFDDLRFIDAALHANLTCGDASLPLARVRVRFSTPPPFRHCRGEVCVWCPALFARRRILSRSRRAGLASRYLLSTVVGFCCVIPDRELVCCVLALARRSL